MALTYTPTAKLGQYCPDFRLPGVDGKSYQRRDFEGSKALLIMFICNHCPYVKAIEDRLIALGTFMNSKGARIVAICSNDSSKEKYSDDSFENLRARAIEKNYSFPYLHDESQEVAKTFAAVCTPDFFLYDSSMQLAYRGRLDDSWKEPSQVQSEELKTAVTDLLEGRKPSTEQKPAMGCNIKWKDM
jgi:peroxiredoxin